MTAAPRPLRRDNAADRSTIARMGGYARQQQLSAEERSAIGRKSGETVLAKYGKGHFQRLALIRQGRLASTTRKAAL